MQGRKISDFSHMWEIKKKKIKTGQMPINIPKEEKRSGKGNA